MYVPKRVLQRVQQSVSPGKLVVQALQSERVLLSKRQLHVSSFFYITGICQKPAGLLVQTWILQRHGKQDRAKLLPGMPEKLVLHGEGEYPILCGQRDLACSIRRLHGLHLWTRIQGLEQHALCGLPEPNILLRGRGGDLQRGDIKLPAGLGSS